jgi:hypothetical protein
MTMVFFSEGQENAMFVRLSITTAQNGGGFAGSKAALLYGGSVARMTTFKLMQAIDLFADWANA